MEQNIQNYAKNAPTYFNDLATSYAKLTNIATTIKGTATPTSDGTPTNKSGSMSTASSSATVKTYDLTGYLPINEKISVSVGSTNAYNAIITSWYKLNSETLSNWTVNSNNQFSFDLVQNYDLYSEMSMSGQTHEFTENTLTVTQTIKDATFASTVLTSLTNSLNNNKQTSVDAGWYMSKCSSNQYTSSDFSKMQDVMGNLKGMIDKLGSTSMLDATNSNTSSSSSTNTINGGTSFNNPTTSSLINSPITTNFYYSIADFSQSEMANTFAGNSLFTVKNNWSKISTSGWLATFASSAIAGYSLNNSNQISSSNQVNNPNTTWLDSLKTPTQMELDVSMSMPNIPTGTIPNSTPSPTPTPTPTKTTPVSSTSLPASLSGSTFTSQDSNWTMAWAKEMTNSDFVSWMEENIIDYANNAPLYFNNLAQEYDSLTKIATSIKPMEGSAEDLTGYLPFISATSTSLDGMSTTSTTIYWLKLDSEIPSNITATNGQFSFTLTQKYSEYSELEETDGSTTMVLSLTPNSFTLTQNVTNAVFAPTLLAPISNSLSTSSTIVPSAAWYMESCKSDTFTSSDWTLALGIPTSLTGKTTFTNPSSKSLINAPLVSDFYNDYVFYHASVASEGSSMKVIDNASALKSNPWLTSILETGIAGYAYNNSNEINGSSIPYDASTTISSLKSTKIELSENESLTSSTSNGLPKGISNPLGDLGGSTTPNPLGTTQGDGSTSSGQSSASGQTGSKTATATPTDSTNSSSSTKASNPNPSK